MGQEADDQAVAVADALDAVVGLAGDLGDGVAGAVGQLATLLSCFRRLQVRWDRDAGRWFAFVLLACAVVCFNRL